VPVMGAGLVMSVVGVWRGDRAGSLRPGGQGQSDSEQGDGQNGEQGAPGNFAEKHSCFS